MGMMEAMGMMGATKAGLQTFGDPARRDKD